MTPTVTLRRIVVSVTSIERALAVYADALGLEVARRAPGLAWLTSADGVELMLHERPATASDTAVAVGFATTALDDTVTRWVAAGGAVADPAAPQPWGERMAVLRDADGHLVCLSESA
ncbi:VOC family protein [Nocardioides sp. SLBN-35]|uniref:VOC family protein n=1 Tax=Nocardioides sp. SLBN-35 TaxID=2768445 RepID=UPI0011506E59|nr:VOC family protein [Nocardioides sp. SLBN-35]TQK70078.1 putative enzyme related to lactoylglutathione lyase [Nocardioides sp. SLBN-35]